MLRFHTFSSKTSSVLPVEQILPQTVGTFVITRWWLMDKEHIDYKSLQLWKFWKHFCHWPWAACFIGSIHFWNLAVLLAIVWFCHYFIFLDWCPSNCFTICRTVSRLIFFVTFFLLKTFIMHPILFNATLCFLEMLIIHYLPRPYLPVLWPGYCNSFT